ncbi:MAG: hypothetical protein ACRD1G_19970, partial [Acidimicrobiales bacterium]
SSASWYLSISTPLSLLKVSHPDTGSRQNTDDDTGRSPSRRHPLRTVRAAHDVVAADDHRPRRTSCGSREA